MLQDGAHPAGCRVQKDMQAYVDKNPDASADDIEAEAKKTTSKHETEMMLQKMRDDNFFNKLMSRRKERIKDMWG